MDEQPPSESRPGRKRSEESRMAILVAAFELVGEVGYAGLTIEGIANRAGCGKQTIYRWWPSKAHVLLEALAVKADLYVTNGDHGSYADDLRAFLQDTFRLGRQQRVVDILRVLMAEGQINEEFGRLFRSAFLQRRRDALQVILDRARTRGDLPPRPAASTVLDIVFGTLWYRLLATRQPMGDDLVEDLTATLAQAAQPPTTTATDPGDQQ
ncbi:AcrR family transcriptional regulator [Streptacidiphilus sp. MAP12-16]|uniref:TetR/AcrR family transcriptional regulator n=1 Tax=Streptacidiphilus sp. MAP12-16 TaxID=3156300 RepID=UPI0035192596